MKTNLFICASPIHSLVIGLKLRELDGDNNVVLMLRGMRNTFHNTKCLFFKSEDILLGISENIELLKIIGNETEGSFHFDLYTPSSNYLFAKIHQRLCFGEVHYIEDGTGTHAFLSDYIHKTDHRFLHALLEDRTYVHKKIVNKMNYNMNQKKTTPRLSRLIFRIMPYLIVIEQKIKKLLSYEVYFDISNPYFKNFIMLNNPYGLTFISSMNYRPIRPTIKEDAYLCLVPPIRQSTSLQSFIKKLSANNKIKNSKIYIKAHPIDVDTHHNNEDFAKFARNYTFAEITFEEPTFWAYENGFKGIICWDSSAIIFNKLYLHDKEFEVIDLAEDGFSSRLPLDYPFT